MPLLISAINSSNSGKTILVRTVEEKEYPQYFDAQPADSDEPDVNAFTEKKSKPIQSEKQEPKEQHLTFEENQRGVSFDSLLGPYLKGAAQDYHNRSLYPSVFPGQEPNGASGNHRQAKSG